MADIMSAQKRSAVMARIRGKDTQPELLARRALHAMGYRYRLYRRDLPGTPDIVFPSRRKVVFVHGCFWHGHSGCRHAVMPATRPEFWAAKIRRNQERDADALAQLQAQGWRVLVLWECEMADARQVSMCLSHFLGGARASQGTSRTPAA
jgi:DNA mismatch endonuclease (patch repair protein)